MDSEQIMIEEITLGTLGILGTLGTYFSTSKRTAQMASA